MEKIIQKAIEGGYRKDILQDHSDLCSCGGSTTCAGKDHYRNGNLYKIVLDPLFWQALIRASHNKDKTSRIWWKHEWHRFIDHLAEGKDINSFFDELLKHPK